MPEIIEAGLAAVAIFPNDFPGAAKIIAEALASKHARGDASALDVLVIANLLTRRGSSPTPSVRRCPRSCMSSWKRR